MRIFNRKITSIFQRTIKSTNTIVLFLVSAKRMKTLFVIKWAKNILFVEQHATPSLVPQKVVD